MHEQVIHTNLIAHQLLSKKNNKFRLKKDRVKIPPKHILYTSGDQFLGRNLLFSANSFDFGDTCKGRSIAVRQIYLQVTTFCRNGCWHG